MSFDLIWEMTLHNIRHGKKIKKATMSPASLCAAGSDSALQNAEIHSFTD